MQKWPPLLSQSTCTVLKVLLTSEGPVWDKELPLLTRMPFAEVFSCLARLKRYQWVDCTVKTVRLDEADPDSQLDRRYFYTLTPDGREWTQTILGDQS